MLKRRLLNALLRMAANANLTCDRVPPYGVGDIVRKADRLKDEREFVVRSGPRYDLVYTTDPPGYQRTSEHEFNLLLVRRHSPDLSAHPDLGCAHKGHGGQAGE